MTDRAGELAARVPFAAVTSAPAASGSPAYAHLFVLCGSCLPARQRESSPETLCLLESSESNPTPSSTLSANRSKTHFRPRCLRSKAAREHSSTTPVSAVSRGFCLLHRQTPPVCKPLPKYLAALLPSCNDHPLFAKQLSCSLALHCGDASGASASYSSLSAASRDPSSHVAKPRLRSTHALGIRRQHTCP